MKNTKTHNKKASAPETREWLRVDASTNYMSKTGKKYNVCGFDIEEVEVAPAASVQEREYKRLYLNRSAERDNALAELKRVRQERDELLAAFEPIWKAWHAVLYDNAAMNKAVRAMHAAIANREGRAE